MLQPAGVVVVFQQLHLIGKAEGRAHLHLVFRLVGPVTAGGAAFAEHHGGQSVQPGNLLHIVLNAVFVVEGLFGGLGAGFVPQNQRNARVDHGLALHHIPEVLGGHVDVGKHLVVGLPADDAAGAAALVGLLVQAAHVLTLFEIQVVVLAVPVDVRGHPVAGVLGGAQAQAVQAQGELIIIIPGRVLAACVHLAEQQLPVVPILALVVIHGHTAAEVLHLNASVLEAGDNDFIAVSFPGLVNGVGEDLENGMGAALHAVGAENNGWALANPIRAFQAGNAFVVVGLFVCHGCLRTLSIRFFGRSAAPRLLGRENQIL